MAADDPGRQNPFHDVGKLFSGDKTVESVAPDTPVVNALAIMIEHRFSQLPVIDKGNIRGVFSLWSLAQQLTESPNLEVSKLVVEDAMSHLPQVTVQDSLHSVLALIEQHEAVLVNSPHGLQAIATAVDLLKYFYRVARPYIILSEIELSLRSLIYLCAPGDKLKGCISRSIEQLYTANKRPVPAALEEMSFEDYRSIIVAKDNWPLFSGVLGRNRELVLSKLERIRRIRNDVFHFRADISVMDHETLAATREWLLDKATVAEKREDRHEP